MSKLYQSYFFDTTDLFAKCANFDKNDI